MIEEEFVDAGELTSPPPLPKGGIPKQWLPKFVRFAIQIICLPFVYVDLMAVRIARLLIQPPFYKQGKCRRRGNCCYYIKMKKTKPWLQWMQVFWATQVNGFFFRKNEPIDVDGKKYYLFGCRHLAEDGSCKNYRLRPSICRQWPDIERFGYPVFLKGCGYRAISAKDDTPFKVIQ